MNTNLIHNILNILIAIVPPLQAYDWTPFMSQDTALKVVGVLGLLKILINVARDGMDGLYAQQPPVIK